MRMMRNWISVVITLICLCAGAEDKKTAPPRILRVIDGDTFEAEFCGRKHLFQLDGIDAPELDQPFGKEAKEFLESKILGKTFPWKNWKGRSVAMLVRMEEIIRATKVDGPLGKNLADALIVLSADADHRTFSFTTHGIESKRVKITPAKAGTTMAGHLKKICSDGGYVLRFVPQRPMIVIDADTNGSAPEVPVDLVMADGKALAIVMVRAGLAYRRGSKDKGALAEAAQKAEAQKLKVWSNPKSVAPWQHRSAQIRKAYPSPKDRIRFARRLAAMGERLDALDICRDIVFGDVKTSDAVVADATDLLLASASFPVEKYKQIVSRHAQKPLTLAAVARRYQLDCWMTEEGRQLLVNAEKVIATSPRETQYKFYRRVMAFLLREEEFDPTATMLRNAADSVESAIDVLSKDLPKSLEQAESLEQTRPMMRSRLSLVPILYVLSKLKLCAPNANAIDEIALFEAGMIWRAVDRSQDAWVIFEGQDREVMDHMVNALRVTPDDSILSFPSFTPVELPPRARFASTLRRLAAKGNAPATRILTEFLLGRYRNEEAAKALKVMRPHWSVADRKWRKEMLHLITGPCGTFHWGTRHFHAAGAPFVIPYQHRNSKRVDLTLYQLNEKHRARTEKLRKKNTSLAASDLDQYLEGAKVTKRWHLGLTPDPRHFDRVTPITVPALPPGYYLLRARMKGGSECAIGLWLSEAAVVVLNAYPDGDSIFAVNAATGKPLPNLRLQVRPCKEEKEETEPAIRIVETDKNGSVALPMEIETVSFYGNKETPKLRLRWLWGDYERKSGYPRSFITTDRPAYRPGDTVKFKAWAFKDPKVESEPVMKMRLHTARGKQLTIPTRRTKRGSIIGEVKLDKTSSLGGYSLSADSERDGQVFKVDDYQKSGIEVKIIKPEKTPRIGEKIKFKIRARYLFGQPAPNAKVFIDYTASTDIEKWYPTDPHDWLFGRGYWWFSPAALWYPGWEKWGQSLRRPHGYHGPPGAHWDGGKAELRTDKNGEATYVFDSSSFISPWQDRMGVQLGVTVVDANQQSNGTGTTLVVGSHKSFPFVHTTVGFAEPGEPVGVICKSITASGKPTRGEGVLELQRVTWKVRVPTAKTVVSWPVKIDGTGSKTMRLPAPTPGQYRIVFRMPNGQESGVLFTVPGAIPDGGIHCNGVSVVSEKKHYSPGETARLMVSTDLKDVDVAVMKAFPFARPQFVRFLRMKNRGQIIELPVGDRSFQVLVWTVNGGRLYRDMRLIAVPPQMLRVSVKASPEKCKPGEKQSLAVQVTDASGKPIAADLCIAAYDKAVDQFAPRLQRDLRSARWQLDNPWSCRCWTSWPSLVLYEFPFLWVDVGDSFFMRGLGIFVDNEMRGIPRREHTPTPLKMGEKGRDSIVPRKAFADTAFWTGVAETGKDGQARFSFKVPDNLSTWRVRVWAVDGRQLVGSAETRFVSAKDFLVRPRLPRFLVEGDFARARVELHNYSRKEQSVNAIASSSARDVLRVITTESDPTTFRVPHQGQKGVFCRLFAETAGKTKIQIKAGNAAVADGVELPFVVQPHGAEQSRALNKVITAGKAPFDFEFEIPAKILADRSEMTLSLAASTDGACVQALPYLFEFPHDCTEQTLSRFAPAALLMASLKKRSIKPAKLTEAGVSPKRIDALVKEGMASLNARQSYEGGWSWFSGKDSPYVTAYVVRFLLRLRDSGIKFPDKMLPLALKYLQEWRKTELERLHAPASKGKPRAHCGAIHAFVEKLLTTQKLGDKSMVKQLYDQRFGLSLVGQCHLAAILHLSKDTNRRDLVLLELRRHLDSSKKLDAVFLRPTRNSWSWDSNEVETNVEYLGLIHLMNPADPQTVRVQRYLLSQRSGSHWSSTRSTALCIDALLSTGQTRKGADGKVDVSISLEGKTVGRAQFSAGLPFSKQITIDPKLLTPGKHRLKVVATGSGQIHAGGVAQWFSLQKTFPASADGMRISRRYMVRVPGKEDEYRETTRFKVGDVVQVRIDINAELPADYALIEIPKPAGFEPINTSSGPHACSGAHTELRDNRTVLYVSRLQKGLNTFTYRMRAVTPGRYTALPARASLMYEPTVRASTADTIVTIPE